MDRINLKQIFLWSQEETILIDKLREFGAMPKEGDVKCSTCSTNMHLWFHTANKEWFWRCNKGYITQGNRKKKCNKKISVKAMSIFEGAHLSFEQILIFIHEWCHFSEIRKASLEASIGSPTTASIYNKFCTEVVINACFQNSIPIGE